MLGIVDKIVPPAPNSRNTERKTDDLSHNKPPGLG